MQVLGTNSQPGEPADPAHFTGSVRLHRLATGGEHGIKVFRVEFEPAARTHWHVHSGPQVLVVLEGVCRVASRGGRVEEVRPGESVIIDTGEKHWHGAAPGSRMVHLAINVRTETSWLEPVSDDDFARLA
jgi:quercetin dioxygenase-like cupin family protein